MASPSETDDGKARRGRPRRGDVEALVTRVTLEALRDMPYSELSIELISERTGISKPTLYRRWPSKAALVTDVIVRSASLASVDPEADLKEELRRIAVAQYSKNRDSGIMYVIPSLVGEMRFDPQLRELFRERYIYPHVRVVEHALIRGVATGLIRADIDVMLIVQMLAGSILHRGSFEGQPLDDAEADRVFEVIWDAIRVRTPADADH